MSTRGELLSHEVTYSLNKRHVVAFQVREMWHRWFIRLLILALLIYHFGVLLPRYWAMPGSNLQHLISAGLFTLLAFGGVAICVVASLWFMFSASQNATLLTEHHLTIAESGLVEDTALSHAELSWAGVLRLSRSSRYFYIYPQQYAAMVIPLSCFASSEAANEFFAASQRFWRKARDA